MIRNRPVALMTRPLLAARMRTPALATGLLLIALAVPADAAPDTVDAAADPGCYSTLDYPPSHIWCETGVIDVHCYHQAGGYHCRV